MLVCRQGDRIVVSLPVKIAGHLHNAILNLKPLPYEQQIIITKLTDELRRNLIRCDVNPFLLKEKSYEALDKKVSCL